MEGPWRKLGPFFVLLHEHVFVVAADAGRRNFSDKYFYRPAPQLQIKLELTSNEARGNTRRLCPFLGCPMIGPSLSEIRAASEALEGVTLRTPVLPLSTARWGDILPEQSEVRAKLELFQQAGSFKARGAYLGILKLTDDEKAAGVIAASGGNHALAVSWAAKAAGVRATICMPEFVDPVRIEGCKAMGAEVILTADMARAFTAMEKGADDGKTMMHPFDGEHMTLGSATCGLEYVEAWPDADVFVLPVGGSGLIGGMGCAIKQVNPDATVIGVEPTGADSLTQSLSKGAPVVLDRIDTIADSLGAPKSLPYSFEIARTYVDRMVHVTDDEMRDGMRHYLSGMQILAEPACAASLAAVCGPLREELAGQRVAIIACGSNISPERFAELTG